MDSRFWNRVHGVLVAVVLSLAVSTISRASEPVEAKASMLEAAVRAIDDGEVASQHALLIYQYGELVLERYWPGRDGKRGDRLFGPDELHDVRSCTKSVVGLLVGIAHHEGRLPDLDTPAHALFPDLFVGDDGPPSEAHQRITLRHLLDMTDGLAWQQGGTLPWNNEAWMERDEEPVRYVWTRKVATPAGEVFNYSSGATVLLGGALTRAVGQDLEAYAVEKLFAPLGIERWEWMKDRAGNPSAHFGLRLTPRDMLKLGRLVLQGGRWGEEQLVPEAWIDATADRKNGERSYGCQWWLDTYQVDGQAVHAIAAGGKGGQYIHVFPLLDAVIVSTAGHYDDDEAASSSFGLVERWILPVLLEEQGGP